MLQVTFHPFETIQEEINPRWRALREMVEDMQKMLLTGGVKTNIFQDAKKKDQTNDTFVFVLNDKSQLEQAKEFFEDLGEVKQVLVMGENPNAEVIYSHDEL